MEINAVDHILRAAGAATGQSRFVLVGSAAIFAWRAVVPSEMAMTREADLFAYDVDRDTAERISDTLDGVLGQSSQFDEAYGYYCDGGWPGNRNPPSRLGPPREGILKPGYRWRRRHRPASERYCAGEAVRRPREGYGLVASCGARPDC